MRPRADADFIKPLFSFSRTAVGRSGHRVAFRTSRRDARPTEICQVGGCLTPACLSPSKALYRWGVGLATHPLPGGTSPQAGRVLHRPLLPTRLRVGYLQVTAKRMLPGLWRTLPERRSRFGLPCQLRPPHAQWGPLQPELPGATSKERGARRGHCACALCCPNPQPRPPQQWKPAGDHRVA